MDLARSLPYLETKARFIAQVITGDSTIRQAEDIGGQELSYAEVKAIASGNPAVLTLAEADAKLKRLQVLHKHHADEQYLARRHVRELPTEIARLERRETDLTTDMATAHAHAADPITIGSRTYRREDAIEILGGRLRLLPALVQENQRVPLGAHRGLQFGMLLHPHGAPDVYVQGTLTRLSQLSREFQGPRAILHAVERLINGYEGEREKVARDLRIAQGQQRDYEARLGTGFPQKGYLDELTGLRNQLEAALSSHTQQVSDATLPSTEEIVERIKALQAAHTVEALPERTTRPQAVTMEEAVTTRIRNRVQEPPTAQPEAEAVLAEAPATPVAHPVSPTAQTFTLTPLFVGTRPRTAPPVPLPQERAGRTERGLPARQLALF